MPQLAHNINFDGPFGAIKAIFGEAKAEQRLLCIKLGATDFRYQLSVEAYLEREKFLEALPLTCDSAMRIWCLFDAKDPLRILAACKTIPRQLLVRDSQNNWLDQGYCVSSVVSDPSLRGKGLGSFLLQKVAEWMDGPGNTAASFLYTSKCLFYQKQGWDRLPSLQATININLASPLVEKTGLPNTRLLTALDIPKLCEIDVDRVTQSISNAEVEPGSLLVSMLPTEATITWLQERAEFVSPRSNEVIPEFKGAIDEKGKTWLYWCHDFRKGHLAVQRVSIDSEDDDSAQTLASLVLDARNEAAAWNLPRVSIWNPTEAMKQAMSLVSGRILDGVVCEEQRNYAHPMIRMKNGDKSKHITLRPNEYYGRN